MSFADVERLLGIVRDAAVGADFRERFAAITESILAVVPGTSASAMLLDLDDAEPLRSTYFRNQPEENLAHYAAHYRHHDPMGSAIVAPPPRPVLLSELAGRSFGTDPFTGEFLPRGGIRHVLGLPVRLRAGWRFALALHRPAGHGDFSRRDLRLISLIAPDLARAAELCHLHERVARARASDAPQPAAACGTITFDAAGEVLSATPAVLAALSDALPTGEVPLVTLSLLARTIGAGEPGATSPHERLFAYAADRLVIAQALAMHGEWGAEVLAVVRTIDLSAPRDVLDRLAAERGLSPRQRQVAALVHEGLTNERIARTLGIRAATVAEHLTQIYRKLGTPGRLELTRLLSRGAGAAGPPS